MRIHARAGAERQRARVVTGTDEPAAMGVTGVTSLEDDPFRHCPVCTSMVAADPSAPEVSVADRTAGEREGLTYVQTVSTDACAKSTHRSFCGKADKSKPVFSMYAGKVNERVRAAEAGEADALPVPSVTAEEATPEFCPTERTCANVTESVVVQRDAANLYGAVCKHGSPAGGSFVHSKHHEMFGPYLLILGHLMKRYVDLTTHAGSSLGF
jgi:hypothetical protein